MERETAELNRGWKFFRGANELAWQELFDNSGWQTITIQFQSRSVKLFFGQALILVQAEFSPLEVVLDVNSDGLHGDKAILQTEF